MVDFIIAHWWTWPAVYLVIGGLLAGFFSDTPSAEWIVLLWPLFVAIAIGAFIRGVFT